MTSCGGKVSDPGVKGCLIFVALFFVGVVLIVTGLVQDLMTDGFGIQAATPEKNPRGLSRVLEVAGLVLIFGSIYGAAAWKFVKRDRSADQPPGRRK